MAALPGAPFWDELHRAANALAFGECWTHCGSYCCKTNHAAQDFKLIKCDSAGMVFPLGEYAFLKSNGFLQTGFEKTTRHHTFSISPERRLEMKFVTAHCDLGGICSNPDWRPLICKFYPLYPVPSASGEEIRSYVAGSIIDQYWSDLDIEHPCWLYRTKAQMVMDAIKAKTQGALKHPYMIFYMGAAEIFVVHVAARARALPHSKSFGDARQFFRDWEVSYLMGQLVDQRELKADLAALYDAVAAEHGPFEI